MKLSRLFSVILLLLCFGACTEAVAQVKGGRKREHRNQRGGGGLFHFRKSTGHADAFAKGGQKRGFFARIFKGNKSGSAWVYKKTKPGIKQKKEQPQLFTRNRTKGKRYTDGVLARQNHQRSARRVRGNSSFSKSKR